MISVTSTLADAARIGLKNYRPLLAIGLISAMPLAVLTMMENIVPSDPSDVRKVLVTGLVSILYFVALIVVGAMKTAAVFGILRRAAYEPRLWPVVAESVRTYTGPLARLSVVLMVIAFIVWVPAGFLMAPLMMLKGQYVAGVVAAFLAIVYLIFVKFALATPLVVVEGLPAHDAVKVSWTMTRGQFWYVLGCYVLIAVGEYCVELFCGFLVPHRHSMFKGVFNVEETINATVIDRRYNYERGTGIPFRFSKRMTCAPLSPEGGCAKEPKTERLCSFSCAL
jgi:hypothetical protein